MTYDEAAQLFSTSRYGSKNLGQRSTWLEKDGDDYVIRYHQTYVVRIHANGFYTLKSGGWKTMTTKKRINEYSSANLYQRDFEWYLADGTEFHDGIIVDRNGKEANIPESIKRRMHT